MVTNTTIKKIISKETTESVVKNLGYKFQ